MEEYIDNLRKQWKPETKDMWGYDAFGDDKKYTLYFDEYRLDWTSKERAFQGYVFKNIRELI